MGALVQIDDPLAHVLTLFWKNRFETFFSCSGHFYEENMNPYVVSGSRIADPTNRQVGPRQYCSSINIDRLHEKAQELLRTQPTSQSYVLNIGEIENKNINVPYIREPLFVRRFDVRARNKEKSYHGRIETQAAFLRFLYDLAVEAVVGDNAEKMA
jgi:hypothetical protein